MVRSELKLDTPPKGSSLRYEMLDGRCLWTQRQIVGKLAVVLPILTPNSERRACE